MDTEISFILKSGKSALFFGFADGILYQICRPRKKMDLQTSYIIPDLQTRILYQICRPRKNMDLQTSYIIPNLQIPYIIPDLQISGKTWICRPVYYTESADLGKRLSFFKKCVDIFILYAIMFITTNKQHIIKKEKNDKGTIKKSWIQ